MLLRLARNLRRETEALGRHVAPGDAPLARPVAARSLAARARERGGHLRPVALRARRPARGRRAPAPCSLERRPSTRRPRADRRRTGAAEARPGSSHELARRAARQPHRRGARAARARRSRRSPPSSSRDRERPRARPRPPDVPLAPPPPQLPPLLRRAGRLARRHVDAEHRARVARDRALRLGARRRRARLLPLRAVPPPRARRRRADRPLRHAPAPGRDAGDRDARLGRARDRDADRLGDAPARLRARRARRARARLRRAGSSDAHVPDGRARRSCRTRSRSTPGSSTAPA